MVVYSILGTGVYVERTSWNNHCMDLPHEVSNIRKFALPNGFNRMRNPEKRGSAHRIRMSMSELENSPEHYPKCPRLRARGPGHFRHYRRSGVPA